MVSIFGVYESHMYVDTIRRLEIRVVRFVIKYSQSLFRANRKLINDEQGESGGHRGDYQNGNDR